MCIRLTSGAVSIALPSAAVQRMAPDGQLWAISSTSSALARICSGSGVIKVLVGHQVLTEENKGRVLEYINGLNERLEAFKYVATQDGHLELKCSLVADEAHFDPELILVMLLNVIQPHLESEVLRLPAVVGGPVGVNAGNEETAE